ncbi:MAG: hypothetical protein OYH76_17545 [Defluviicoccus sp.]|nr:hypothetical protein [Defluviicoccus sp.]MDE0277702.1 hypothetical protein [Defluviicoccus sp.]
MSLKQNLARFAPRFGAIVLAFALGVATAWIAMRSVATDIRAEMRGQIAQLRDDAVALRTAISALDGHAQKQIGELGRRFAVIERQLGLSPAALPESGAGADPEHRPPLPPRPPARRSSTDR